MNDQLFPGDLDKGTPLVIKEGEDNRNTIIGTQWKKKFMYLDLYTGIFRELLDHKPEGPNLFDRLTADIVNWIVNYADWTQDSNCYTFTSCSCGIPGRPADTCPHVHPSVPT